MDDKTRIFTILAIKKVFGHNLSKERIANNFLGQFSDDEAALFSKLDALCACDFFRLANLQNIVPSPEVSTAISEAITASGGTAPDSIALQNKVGSENLDTVPQDLSSATNALFTITGNTTLATSAQTLGAAVNEVNTKAVALQNKVGTLAFNSNNGQTTIGGMIGTSDISDVTTAAGSAVENTLTATIAASNNKFGDMTALFTSVKSTIVGSLNEIYSALLSSPAVAVCGKVGTLGSFYSCTSLTDTSPILIATGSELCAAKEQAKQRCANWAFSKLLVKTTSPNSAAHPDYSDTIIFANSVNFQPVFGSFSASGSCFSIDNYLSTGGYGYSTATAADSLLVCLYALDH